MKKSIRFVQNLFVFKCWSKLFLNPHTLPYQQIILLHGRFVLGLYRVLTRGNEKNSRVFLLLKSNKDLISNVNSKVLCAGIPTPLSIHHYRCNPVPIAILSNRPTSSTSCWIGTRLFILNCSRTSLLAVDLGRFMSLFYDVGHKEGALGVLFGPCLSRIFRHTFPIPLLHKADGKI